eukprot:1471637-Amphidinium_carterae.1
MWGSKAGSKRTRRQEPQPLNSLFAHPEPPKPAAAATALPKLCDQGHWVAALTGHASACCEPSEHA